MKKQGQVRAAPKAEKLNLFAQPAKGFYRRSILHIQCGGALEVENCRAVLECTEERMRLQMARCEVVLTGENLQLESLNRQTLVLRGRISQITFQQAKREGR